MVLPHAARAHAAKAHMARSQMHDRIVDAAAAKGYIAHKALLHLAILTKDIQSQRRRTIRNKRLRLVQALKRQHRQDGTKDLLLHDGILGRHAVQNRRLNLERGLARSTSQHNLVGVDQPTHAREMLGVDDMAVVLVVERVLAKHAADLFLDEAQQLIVHARIDQQIVGRYTGLAHVEPLTKGDAACCHAQVCRGVHDAGALAAQLKCHGREVFARALHDELADRNAAGKENLIPALIEQCLVLGTTALDDRHQTRIKRFLANLPEHRTRSRRIGARLDNHGVARGKGTGKRFERQQKRIVPRRHDQRHAIGNRLRLAHANGVGKVTWTQVCTAPSDHVRNLMANLGKRRADLAHIRLVMRLAQIGLERMGDIVLVCPNRIAQAHERAAASIDIKRGMRLKIGALAANDARDFLGVHGPS